MQTTKVCLAWRISNFNFNVTLPMDSRLLPLTDKCMHLQACNFSVQPNFSKQVLLMTDFIVPVSWSVDIFFPRITVWKSVVLLSSRWICIISWGHSSQKFESSVWSCSYKSQNCEFSSSIPLVGAFPISLINFCMSLILCLLARTLFLFYMAYLNVFC